MNFQSTFQQTLQSIPAGFSVEISLISSKTFNFEGSEVVAENDYLGINVSSGNAALLIRYEAIATVRLAAKTQPPG
jgi:hypothetical protein